MHLRRYNATPFFKTVYFFRASSFLTIIFVFFIFENNVYADELGEDEIAYNDAIKLELTDTYFDPLRTYLGESTIKDYAKSITKFNNRGIAQSERALEFAGEIYLDDDNKPCIYQDDPIIHIVPKYFFQNICERNIYGKEYGFYIKTEYSYFYPSRESRSKRIRGYHSTILVYDFGMYQDSNGDDDIYDYFAPLFSKNYYCMPSGACDYKVQNISQDYAVFPTPDATDNILNIKDVNYGFQIKNKYSLNEGDNGYSIENDQGVYLVKIVENINDRYAISSKEKDFKFVSVGLNVISEGLEMAGQTGLAKIFSFMGLVYANASYYDIHYINSSTELTKGKFVSKRRDHLTQHKHYIRNFLSTINIDDYSINQIFNEKNLVSHVIDYKGCPINGEELIHPSTFNSWYSFDICDYYGNIIIDDFVFNINDKIGYIDEISTDSYINFEGSTVLFTGTYTPSYVINIKHDGYYQNISNSVSSCLVYKILEDGTFVLCDSINMYFRKGENYYIYNSNAQTSERLGLISYDIEIDASPNKFYTFVDYNYKLEREYNLTI